MKRIVLLIIAALLLVGCGLDSIPQDGLTNAVGLKGGDETLVATNIKCDIHPLIGSNKAQVICQLDITGDGTKLGLDKSAETYLGGALGGENIFESDKPFSSSGTGNLQLLGEPFSSGDGRSTTMAVTAEMDGFRAPVEIIGMAGGTMGDEPAMFHSKEELHIIWIDLSFSCQGEMIPNSSLANITFTGEGKDGQQIAGGGLLDTNLMSLDEMCNDVSAEGVVYEIEVTDFIKLGDIKGEFKLGIIRDGDTGQPIMLGVVINHEEQYS